MIQPPVADVGGAEGLAAGEPGQGVQGDRKHRVRDQKKGPSRKAHRKNPSGGLRGNPSSWPCGENILSREELMVQDLELYLPEKPNYQVQMSLREIRLIPSCG